MILEGQVGINIQPITKRMIKYTFINNLFEHGIPFL